MVFQLSLLAEELGIFHEGRWARMMRKLLIMTSREINWEVLSQLGMGSLDRKLTPATTVQEECQHLGVKVQGSQWYRSLMCFKCHLRLRYMPTILAVASAQVKQQRRRIALQQAGRLARTTKVARELSAAQIREQAVQECQESANAAAAQEVSVAQPSGLMAITDALNRLSEQNLMLHTQTQALMSRLAPAAAEAPDTVEMFG